jgi:hypothetical protein
MNNSESWEEAYESRLEHLALTAVSTDSAMWCVCWVQALNRRPQQQPFRTVTW